MTVTAALIAFSVAAGLLTITPGLDVALVLRTAAVEGTKKACLAGLGVCIGTLGWGAIAALGLGALLAASQLAFEILKWAGAAYLVWLGLNLILKPRTRFELDGAAAAPRSDLGWLWKGALNNLLNPKAGVFYVSFLPQFVPANVPAAPFMFGLACIHVAMGLVWFAVLIGATRPIAGVLQRASVVRWLDRITGGVFLGFGVRLAMERR
ncbi:LysE family translocator [Phenylobacterium soli]|uniref:LysE family translocator n=1 Tax=Phenylobacterium soli TaxID=2170551 RepID=A0A328AEK7_9CAUL|nr:LysE family translocator [Phenylobacterium soli]RAK53061.1 LysE family translocator [Phenylobacterium soli]